MNNTRELDIIEIVLKKDLKIPLNELEEKLFNNLDEQIKNDLFDLVNSSSFLDEIENVVENIIKKSYLLPPEEQNYIKTKCNEKIRKLKFPNLSV